MLTLCNVSIVNGNCSQRTFIYREFLFLNKGILRWNRGISGIFIKWLYERVEYLLCLHIYHISSIVDDGKFEQGYLIMIGE